MPPPPKKIPNLGARATLPPPVSDAYVYTPYNAKWGIIGRLIFIVIQGHRHLSMQLNVHETSRYAASHWDSELVLP